MKKFPLILLALALTGACAKFNNSELKNPGDDTGAQKAAALLAVTDTVTLYSNGYVYPKDQSNGYGSISSSGLGAWTDSSGFTRVFFNALSTGSITVKLRVKAPGGANTLRIRLDSSGTATNVVVNQTNSYVTLNAGTFNITTTGYHCLEIKAATKNGTYLPDIQSAVITSSIGLKYNRSQYRGAPATHLSYPVPPNTAVAWFYNEIYVPAGADPLYAYYMTNGFWDGYFGIQVNSPTERRVLFSIWSNYNTNDPNEIPADYAVTLVKKGANVTHNAFGNEGSGGQSYLKFPWITGNTYKLLVHAEASGTHTIFTGYFYAPETGSWKLIAQWDKSKTNGQLLGGLYSFVENYSDNGNNFFKARYGNQWVCTTAGTWIELTKASFTTTANETSHQRYDLGAGLENNFFYMFSGGFRQVGNSVGQTYDRTATGTPPAINFNQLPNN
ncbi:DUF3472 domain-containing protein [Chitinophaga nivalis]|uniref:DUF3472 domain-containing protein n=1 Tax=Chitinophaga nivalis TaxID=2991709 RepID=A0ABT3IF16_9BACT|nr:DUF3472 domain-containing protein [Chitinophaga nivalis]MCW3467760.1 DUF3472 domain-containing protein [Chitinophaga nivalis]MCW3482548.1 DUF3472 domain-containing protein [Chitinophaga nivalis]